jgi:hypothetical protein
MQLEGQGYFMTNQTSHNSLLYYDSNFQIAHYRSHEAATISTPLSRQLSLDHGLCPNLKSP